jgi:hypothetical protein
MSASAAEAAKTTTILQSQSLDEALCAWKAANACNTAAVYLF